MNEVVFYIFVMINNTSGSATGLVFGDNIWRVQWKTVVTDFLLYL